MAAKVSDPNVVMRLLRHTNLTTTTKYLRTVKDRMQEAVKNLGANFGGQSLGSDPLGRFGCRVAVTEGVRTSGLNIDQFGTGIA